MSVPTIILGYIEEAWPGMRTDGEATEARLLAAADAIEEHDDKVLNALPEEDDFPPLCRSMFGWPARKTPIAFRNRIIHFGACLKNADFRVRDWLDKFENLLRQTYWESAYVRVHGAYIGTHELKWQPANEWVEELCKGHLSPISAWSFLSTMPADDLKKLKGG